jgi:hypothetical protein
MATTKAVKFISANENRRADAVTLSLSKGCRVGVSLSNSIYYF